MLFTIYGNPDSGKTTLARHIARRKQGKTLIVINEGSIKAEANEQVIEMPSGVNPLDWLKGKWEAIKEHHDKVDCIIIDSITGINDAYSTIALERCKRDDKMKNKSPTELKEMTLSTIPYGMGESTRAELVKDFVSYLAQLAKTKLVIVTGHTMLISVTGSDQLTQDLITLGLGGKSEKSASSRNALQQHSDVIAYCDATPIMLGKVQEPSRKLIVGASGLFVTKYKSTLFGKDEFFEPKDSYDIRGKEKIAKTIAELF